MKKKTKTLLTNPLERAIINLQKVNDTPKNEKGFDTMATTNRVTKAQRYSDIIALLNGEGVKFGTTIADAVDFCNHEVELIAKKNTTASMRKNSENAKNDAYKELIAKFMATVSGDGMTCTEIGKSIAELADFNTSKMSALCNAMTKDDDGRLIKTVVKGKSLFKLA